MPTWYLVALLREMPVQLAGESLRSMTERSLSSGWAPADAVAAYQERLRAILERDTALAEAEPLTAAQVFGVLGIRTIAIEAPPG